MELDEIRALLKEKGQEHLLRYYDELNEAERRILLDEIAAIDWSIFEERGAAGGEITPIGGLSLAEISARRGQFEEVGISALRAGKLCAVLLAGGQGTRLGIEGPKGAYDIGITRPVYIFQRLIENLLGVCKTAGVFVPLYIMTSDLNDHETQRFLAEHDYFGYPAQEIRFFRQDMAPSTDLNGKILLADKGHLVLSSNGNGGWFSSLCRAGLLQETKARGVEWFNVFAVDNVLQRIADPVFLGATILSKKNSGAKVVMKTDPHERVGVLCLRGGVPDIVEYYELTEEMANARDRDGKLLYGQGVILNYLFRVSKLEEVAANPIPVHRVKKKVPYFDGTNTVIPKQPNAYKYETLILDMVRLMESDLPFEVVRAREFAPIKNLTGEDSVETARALLLQNGIEL